MTHLSLDYETARKFRSRAVLDITLGWHDQTGTAPCFCAVRANCPPNGHALYTLTYDRHKRLLTDTSVTLVDFQLDAQNSYLFTYNTFIKIVYMFRALPCSSSGGLRRNCVYAASGIVNTRGCNNTITT